MAKPKPVLTSEQIRQAGVLAGFGMTVDKIALVLGHSKSAFFRILDEAQKAFNAGTGGENNLYEVMEAGRAKVDAKIMQTAYELAVNERNVPMVIFLCKTRLGWREKDPMVSINAGPHVEGEKEIVYRVEINKDGKFVSASPKKVKAG